MKKFLLLLLPIALMPSITACQDKAHSIVAINTADKTYKYVDITSLQFERLMDQKQSFFIEFFTINPALGGDEPVFGQLPENKAAGKKPSYMMVKAGCWGEGAKQLHRFFGWNQVNIKEDAPFLISADNCFCSETRTLGMVEVTEEDAANHPEWMCQPGKMIWDLNIEKNIAFNVGYGASWASREIEAFEMFWHAEGMKTFFNGSVILDGEEYGVDKDSCYGYADKNRGKDFTSPWI